MFVSESTISNYTAARSLHLRHLLGGDHLKSKKAHRFAIQREVPFRIHGVPDVDGQRSNRTIFLGYMSNRYCDELLRSFERLRQPSVAKPLQGILGGGALGVLVLLVLAFVSIASNFAKEFELESAAKKEAHFAAVDGREPSEIRDDLIRKAQSLGLNLDENAIKIHADPPINPDQESEHLMSMLGLQSRSVALGHVDISVAYEVPCRYPGGVAMMHFHFEVNDHSL
jgi:hypothetical protein